MAIRIDAEEDMFAIWPHSQIDNAIFQTAAAHHEQQFMLHLNGQIVALINTPVRLRTQWIT